MITKAPPHVYGAGKRLDLQGMRAVAVLTVFANHLFDWPSGGFVGVDVFFVLSGFFITGILLKERTQTRELSFKNFYVRRAKRILPSALLVLVVTVIGAQALFTAGRARGVLVDGLYASIFLSNFRFEAVGADYFQRDLPQSPIQHYWSLSIEEQFYFVWPVLLVLLFAITHRAKKRGRAWARQWMLFGCMAAIVAASFGWAMFLSSSDPNAAYFSTFTRVWELGAGALLAIAGPWLMRLPDALRPVLAYVGLAGVAASLFLITPTVQFPAPWAALPVVSTAFIVASFHGAPVRRMFVLTNPVAQWFGDTSYTLYLWHWPVITLLLAVTPRGTVFYVLAVVLSLGLTALTYHFYENPIRTSSWLLETPKTTQRNRFRAMGATAWAGVGAIAAAAVVLSILNIRFNDTLAANAAEYDAQWVEQIATPPPAITVQPAKVVTPLTVALPGKGACYGAAAMIDTSCALRNPAVDLTPSLDEFASDGGQPVCWTPKDEPLKSCTYGYRGPDAVRIALVGDSHAQRILVAIAPYLESRKWQLTTYLGWGCSWQLPAGKNCDRAMPEIQDTLLEQPYDLVVTTSSRAWGSDDAYVRAWRPVAAAGSRIAVIADNPSVSEESIACLTRVGFGSDRTGTCGMSTAEALSPDPLVDATERVPAATLIDLTSYYCTNDRCPSVIGDVIVYSDSGGHVTATFIRTLAPAIVEGVRSALTAP